MKISFPSIFGNSNNPYYIYAPSWRENSAGIRCLHYLCHALNLSGQKAYLVINNRTRKGSAEVSPNLVTPVLTRAILRSHIELGYKPIVVLSETVIGNPLRGGLSVRWFLNYIGNLGVQESGDDDHLRVAYSRTIRDSLPRADLTLFLPAINPDEVPYVEKKNPGQVLLYAAKYRQFVGDPKKLNLNHTVELMRDGKNKYSRKDALNLISQSELCYVLENTSVATESVLSGTPAIFIPNEFLNQPLAQEELGWSGYGIGIDQISRAKLTVSAGRRNYLKCCQEFQENLETFIMKSQTLSKATLTERPSLPFCLGTRNRTKAFFQITKSRGPLTALSLTFQFLIRVLKG